MENDEYLCSEPYKMNGLRFASEMIFRYGGTWLLSLSAVGVIGIVAGIVVDLRWLVLALMVVFIVIPMVMAYIYYYYGLRKECYVNVVEHTARIDDESIVMTLLLPSAAQVEDTESEETENNVIDCSASDSTVEKRRVDVAFPYSDLKRLEMGMNSIVIKFKINRKGFLWIPANAFTDEAQFVKVYDALSQKIENI